jgi:hypothetical protein
MWFKEHIHIARNNKSDTGCPKHLLDTGHMHRKTENIIGTIKKGRKENI